MLGKIILTLLACLFGISIIVGLLIAAILIFILIEFKDW